MAHGILLNRYTVETNNGAIDNDYDIFRISGSSDDYMKSNILDIPNTEFKALSVQYTFGKVAFVLFTKGKVEETAFRIAIQERFKDTCVQKIDITNEEERKNCYLYDNVLVQLFANAIRTPKNEIFSYNNTTGKLYYIPAKWKKKDSFYCIEIKFEKGNILKLHVRSFRKKSEKDTTTGLIFDPKSGELRKKLSSDKNVTEYIQKGFKNSKNTVDFLRFNSKEDFYHSKLGILYRFLKDIEDEYGKYFTLKSEESENTYDHEIARTEKGDQLYLHYGRLLKNEVNISDEVKTIESVKIVEKISYELSKFYGISTTFGELSTTGNNIRIIHDSDYYKDNNITDPHNDISKDIVVQHMVVEESKHSELSQKGNNPSADIKKIIQELIIKQDIKNSRITCFDWKSLDFERSVSFISCDEIKHDNNIRSKKQDKEYVYKIIHISPDGEFDLRTFNTKDLLDNNDLHIINVYEDFKKRYAKYPDSMEGIMVTDNDNYSAILKTACTTLPNINAIAESLEQKPFSKETIVDAVSAFKEEMPEYSDYADSIFEKLAAEDEISYRYANSCLDIRKNKKAGSALNRFIYANYGIRINPEIKNKDNEEEYYLKNICNIRYCYEQTWDNKKALVYFVGPKRSSLQQSVHNGCVIRKVYSDNELPDTKKFFPLMSVEFVRNEQYTVIPFPFKYLREYSE